MVKVGYDLELVVLKTIAQTLRKRQGYLRTQLALRYPMKVRMSVKTSAFSWS